MHKHIIDFRAALKHAYYGASDPEAMPCEKTGRAYAHWQVGAADFITRYLNPIFEIGDSPRDIIVAHDHGREYRTTIFPEYKGQKSKKDEEKSPIEIEQLAMLEDWAKKFLAAMGIVQIAVIGVEADDVIAWVVQRLEAAGMTSTVYTVDQDLLVLVSDDTGVSIKNVMYLGAEAVYPEGHDLEGLPLKLTSLAKSIMGDKSDNYGGVRGMGKSAIHKLAEDFGYDGLEDLQAVVASGNTDDLKGAIEETGHKGLIKLHNQFEEWRLGWRLAQLRPELCWKPRKRKLIKPIFVKRVPHPQKTYEYLAAVGCEDMWADGLDEFFPAPFAVTTENWEEMREGILASIAESPLVAFDYESSDKTQIANFRRASPRGNSFVDNLSQVLAGASFQFGKHLENVIYIPVDHHRSANLPKEVIAEILQHAMKHSQIVAHNAYFEGTVTRTNLGFWLTNCRDTRVMQRFYNENMGAGLKELSSEYLSFKQTSYQDTIAAGQAWAEEHGEPAKLMCHLTLDEVFNYGSDDSLVTGHLYDLLQLMLVLDEQWLQYEAMAIRPTEPLQRAYIHGCNINWALQKRLHAADLKTIEEGMAELRQILQDNVSGNITEGCKSLIEAEKTYVLKSATRKAGAADNGADAEQVRSEGQAKLAEWRKKIEAACQYTPYRVEKVMPKFAFTDKQISAALKAVGLPELAKLNHKAWQEYLASVGAEGFSDSWGMTDDQVELIEMVSTAMGAECMKISELRKHAEASEDGGFDNAKDHYQERLATAEKVFEKLGEVVQRLAKIEPREVEFGDALNVGSPVQMQHLLYCKIGAQVRLYGKKAGKSRLALGITVAGPATDEKAIETALANDIKHEWQRDALAVLLKVKSATTRCSLYHDKYPLWRHVDGRIHPYLTDYGTDTGRPTATSTNILAVSKGGVGLRSVYIPPNPDYVCVAIDFNGQELRLLACEANDPVMIDAYNNPAGEKDLHSVTGSGIAASKAKKLSGKEAADHAALGTFEQFNPARKLEDHPLHKLASAIRKASKPVNFGLAYGAGPATLSRNLIIPIEEAKELLDGAMELYNRIPAWQKEQAAFMETHGYTLTAFGTKRHATDDIFHKDNGKVARQHRQGANFGIQGSAADMLRRVLTWVAESGMMDRIRMEFFAPIYDEVVSWVHKDDVLAYCIEMGQYMADSTPPQHVVRQVPEYSIGPDWGRVHELGRDISPENVAKFVARSLEEAREIWEVDMLEPFDPITKVTFDEDAEMVEEEELEAEAA